MGKTSRRRRPSKALVLLVVAAALLLGGIGSRIVDNYQSMADADTIAAVSLAMTGVPAGALPVTVLDIDDSTRAAWQARSKVPHAALARLIGIAAEGGASAIVLDIDLSGDTQDSPPDPELHALIASYPADGPVLMLARRIAFSDGPDGRMIVAASIATPYDSVVEGKTNVKWVTTLNDIDRDRTVRRVRLWQSVCSGSESIAYPSAPLVAGASLLPSPAKDFSLTRFLADRVADDCKKTATPAPPWPGALTAAVTLPYLFPDRADAHALFRISRNGKETIVLRRISAGQIVTVDGSGARAAGEIDRDPFADRVVLIGATDAASGDFYNTPFGTMPGVLVVANGVVQAERLLNAPPMPAWLRTTVILLAFLAFVGLGRVFQGAVAAILISLLSFALVYSIARLFSLADGIAVVATAVTGLALFKLLESLVNIALNVPSRGWRTVLKE